MSSKWLDTALGRKSRMLHGNAAGMTVPVIARMGRPPAGKVRAEAARADRSQATAGEKGFAKPHAICNQWRYYRAPGS